MEPTLQPTIDEHWIGDYKISAQISNHGKWLLCDGSFVDINTYPQLFDLIGYSFGNSSSLFALPDAADRVVGIDGNSNTIGTFTGNEEISLQEDNLPSHWHWLASDSGCNSDNDFTSGSTTYLSWACADSSLISNSVNRYSFRPNIDTEPSAYQSGSVGNGTAFNIMQPTLFVGNLFIYGD